MRTLLLLLCACGTAAPAVHALDLRSDGSVVQRAARGRINGKRVKAEYGQCRDSAATKRLLEELRRAEEECSFMEE